MKKGLVVVFSIICSMGCATLKNKKADKPIIVLTFDDAVISHYTNVPQLLQKYDFGATFFVCEYPRKKPEDTLHYMNWKQIGALDDMGFEIGNHTKNHKHVNKMSEEELVEQLEYIEDKCKAHGIVKPVSFAYPGYDTHPKALKVLLHKDYKYARIGGGKSYVPQEHSPFLIPSYSTTGSSEKAKQRVMRILEQAQPGEIIVLTIHGVPDTIHPHVNTSLELFKHYLEYMKQHDFKVIAMRDLPAYL